MNATIKMEFDFFHQILAASDFSSFNDLEMGTGWQVIASTSASSLFLACQQVDCQIQEKVPSAVQTYLTAKILPLLEVTIFFNFLILIPFELMNGF